MPSKKRSYNQRNPKFKKNKRSKKFSKQQGDNEVIFAPQYNGWPRLGFFVSYVGTSYSGLQFQYHEFQESHKVREQEKRKLQEEQQKEKFQQEGSEASVEEGGLQQDGAEVTTKRKLTKSVELVLAEALEDLGYVPGLMDKSTRAGVNILRACRTDKGVHAAANMVALRVPPKTFAKDEKEDANPQDGRLNGNEKNAPESLDQQEAPATTSTDSTPSAEITEPSTTTTESNPSTKRKKKVVQPSVEQLDKMRDAVNALLPQDMQVITIIPAHKSFNPRQHTCARYYRYLLPKSTLIYKGSSNVLLNRPCKTNVNKDNVRETLDRVLKVFEGSHSYHNFTNHKSAKAGTDIAVRVVTEMKIVEELQHNDETYYVVQIYGQSFLYHQIRKMMACVISLCRGLIAEATLPQTFDTTVGMNLPLAPGHPLYLFQADFRSYNAGYGSTGELRPLELNEHEMERVQKFEHERIQQKFFEIEADANNVERFERWVLDLELSRRSFFQAEEIEPVPKQKRIDDNRSGEEKQENNIEG
eukprot:CAMPEP_0117437124 /NCGR_PEP_ID=MMETSP0759-20121206/1360_1 /TAXON_ID=63605 /ORGANISM="Percolomonas cosmopolitus, Strain WS" /LENGTH=528 /DNA_ID=CAMNT_0005228743 /DNA_START=61 /DNA_END=1647 /DNA_ORIENTATION=-